MNQRQVLKEESSSYENYIKFQIAMGKNLRKTARVLKWKTRQGQVQSMDNHELNPNRKHDNTRKAPRCPIRSWPNITYTHTEKCKRNSPLLVDHRKKRAKKRGLVTKRKYTRNRRKQTNYDPQNQI